MRRRLKILLLYGQSAESLTFSYQIGWPTHFQRHRWFECVPVNVLDRRLTARLRGHLLARLGTFDAIVLLHSVFSNACCIGDRLIDALTAARPPKAYFIGNEYKLMPEKMAFCERLRIALLVTMNPSPDAQQLYRDRLGCAVTCIPSAGLDLEMFGPTVDWVDRAIDIGYRADASPLYLGHDERRQIADFFLRVGPDYGLTLDVSIDPGARLPVASWAAFLNRCRGQLGTEAGGDYFELTDMTRVRVNEYLRIRPNASMREVFDRFFKGYKHAIPARTISGRNVEAAGTKTVQILFEGGYSGYFEPDVHYIPLKKDFSNIDDVMAKFRDTAFCEKLTENAYELAIEELTYEKLIDKFYEALVEVL